MAAFDFSESQILANIFADALDAAGYQAMVKTMTTREVVQPELWSDQVQVVPEYTSSLATFLNSQDNGTDVSKKSSGNLATTMANLRKAAAAHHMVVLDPSGAADQNAFAVTTAFAQANHLTKLSDLAAYRGPLVLGGPAECPSRPYCQPGLEQTYGIQFTGFRKLDPGGPLTKLALKTGQIQVGLVFSSDPGIAAYHLTVLADDRQLQDVDVVVPVVAESAASPTLITALNRVTRVLTTADLMRLNAAVQLQHIDATTVAKDYLAGKGLARAQDLWHLYRPSGVGLAAGVSFLALVAHNIGVKKIRLALTTLAIAIGVLSVVSLGVVTHSLETSALAIMQTGQADFTVAQKGVSDIINSSIDEAQLPRVKATPGVASVVGVLIGTTKLDADNPQFLEIGIDPAQLERFGVTVVQGVPFTASATDQLMLGWRAAENLGAHLGDGIRLDSTLYRVVGIYSTGQALGDAGAMLPLLAFQTAQRQPSQYTLLFVQVTHGADATAVRARIESDNPQLVTIRTVSDFGRADRSLSLIRAADRGSGVLAILIGAVVVMSAMSMSFVERIREFGVLAAVGWSRPRLMVMILAEALGMGLLGAAVGSGLSFLAVVVVQNLPSLTGVLHPEYTTAVFGRALYTAAAMSLLGALHPAVRAALIAPLEALRHE